MELVGVLVPVMGILCGMLAIWTKHQRRLAEIQMKSTATTTAEKAAQYASRVQQLEDRVQVLERIVTDRGYDIATQIEALRDTRRVDDRLSGVPLDTRSRESA